MKRYLLLFRDEGARIGEPDEVCAFVLFNEHGEILSHVGNDQYYAFAYLVGDGFAEQLIGRRCSHEALDPSEMVSRVLKGPEAIAGGLAADECAWKKHDRELDRAAMAQEIARNVRDVRIFERLIPWYQGPGGTFAEPKL